MADSPVFARYRLGRPRPGGPGERVFEAVQLGLDRPVLLHLLDPPGHPQAAARFAARLAALAPLSHPHVLAVYDSGTHDGCGFYVTEALTGETLADRLAAPGTPDLAATLRLAEEVAGALAHAHSRGVAHGGLGPACVAFRDRGDAVVTGWGEPAAGEDAAPEETPGAAPSTRADVYRFGALLYRALTGRPAYPGGAPTPGDAAPGALPRPSALRPEVPAELDHLVMDCLALAPASRAPDLTELPAALERLRRRRAVRAIARGAPGASPGAPANPGPAALPAAAPAARSGAFEAVLSQVTGGFTDPARPETRRRLALVAAPLALGAALGGAYLAGLVGGPAARLKDQTRRVEARRAVLTWSATRPCFSFVEFYTDPARRTRTPVSEAAATEFERALPGLAPETVYFFRYGFSADPGGGAPVFSGVYHLKTRAEVQIRDLRVASRGVDRVTLAWSTSLETDTAARLGTSAQFDRTIRDPGQARELEHTLVLTGLEPDTTYHYQVVAADPDAPGVVVEGPQRTVVTRRLTPPPADPIAQLMRAYIDKLQRMAPAEREKLAAILDRFNPGVDALDGAQKRRLVAGKSGAKNFHDRRVFAALWVEQRRLRGLPLPPPQTAGKADLAAELSYLNDLVLVRPDLARARLDAALRALGAAEGITSD